MLSAYAIKFAFSLDVLLLMVISLAWATSYSVGHTGAAVHGGQARALDTCGGEVSFWVAPVALGDGDEAACYVFHQVARNRRW